MVAVGDVGVAGGVHRHPCGIFQAGERQLHLRRRGGWTRWRGGATAASLGRGATLASRLATLLIRGGQRWQSGWTPAGNSLAIPQRQAHKPVHVRGCRVALINDLLDERTVVTVAWCAGVSRPARRFTMIRASTRATTRTDTSTKRLRRLTFSVSD